VQKLLTIINVSNVSGEGVIIDILVS